MRRFRVVIVEDEELARKVIREYVTAHKELDIIGECEDARTAVEFIDRERPDLLFLDIQLPGVDGFGVLEALTHIPQVIFSTAYDSYAVRAFEVSAVDYLLKPYSQERFDQAVSRALRRLSGRSQPGMAEKEVRRLLEGVAREKPLEKILVKQSGGIVILNVSEIDWAEAMDDYVGLHVGEECYLVKTTLSSLEQRLGAQEFVRVHRSALVNLASVQEIYQWSHGRYRVILKTGKELPLSRSGSQKLKDLTL